MAGVAFSPVGGSYGAAQPVTLATATAGASITYTTDGSTPTQYSTPYTEPISEQYSATLKALAYKTGLLNSPVSSAAYSIAGSPAQLAAVTNGANNNNGGGTLAWPVTITNAAAGNLNIISTTSLHNVYPSGARSFTKPAPVLYRIPPHPVTSHAFPPLSPFSQPHNGATMVGAT